MDKATEILIDSIFKRFDKIDEKFGALEKKLDERPEKKKIFGVVPSAAVPWLIAGLSFGAMVGSRFLMDLTTKLLG